jgi:hypothetical protein
MVESVPWWAIPVTAGIFGLVSGVLGAYVTYFFTRRSDHEKALREQSHLWNTLGREQVAALLTAARSLQYALEHGSGDVGKKFNQFSAAASPLRLICSTRVSRSTEVLENRARALIDAKGSLPLNDFILAQKRLAIVSNEALRIGIYD